MNQLTLGEVISKIESCGLLKDNGEPKQVCFDFGSAVPTDLDSWRGDYSLLALGYKLTGYDSAENHFNETTATNLLEELKNAIGKTYSGWKGGDFKMGTETALWVANSGNADNTVITDVLDDGWRLVIITEYMNY